MDIINLDSSESEDEIDIAWSESPNRSSGNGVINQWMNNSDRFIDLNQASEYNFQKYPRSSDNEKELLQESSISSMRWPELSNVKIGNDTGSNGIGETSSLSYGGANNSSQLNGHTEHAQRRILPSSFQSFTSKTSSKRSHGGAVLSQQKVPAKVKPSNGSGVNLSHMANYRSDTDYKMSEHPQKRTLPPSLQRTMYKSGPDGSIDYKGRKNVAYGYENDDKRRIPPLSLTVTEDDIHIYKSAGTQRVLPPSLMNGKSVSNPVLVDSSDTVNHTGLGVFEHDERAIYQEVLQNIAQPKVEDDLPEGLLSVTLLKHQKMALAWMVHKESSLHCAGGILADDQGLGKTISMIALIQKQRILQSKFTSNVSHQIKPEALDLDDDDEVAELCKDDEVTKLGKERKPEEDDHERKLDPSTSMDTSANWRRAAGTLVVCPASVLRQWARELDEKVTSSAKLSVLIYHGGTRTRDPSELAKYDVVLTTYAIVSNEVPKQSNAADDAGEKRNLDKYDISSEFSTSKRKQQTTTRSKGKKKVKRNKESHLDHDSGPLARVQWFRVILDEAQTIKNHRTLVARACSGLRAKKRWCLSGTPIQNSLDDLYSYFRFLKYPPYNVYNVFCSSLKYPIARNATDGYKKLHAVFQALLLRRTKGTLINGEPIINIPPKTVSLKKVDFSPEERSFYMNLEADSRQEFKKYAAAGTVKQNYASILLMLLRLRQACDHPILVKERHPDTVGKDALDAARKLPRDMIFNLLHQLEGSMALCRVCNDPPEDAVVSTCGHVFCYQCVSESLSGDDNMCPATGCNKVLGPESAFSQATLQSCISNQLDYSASSSGLAHNEGLSIVEGGYVSSKIKAALEILNSLSRPSYGVGSDECDERELWRAVTVSNPEMPVKAIVFSQWTGMLNLLENSLNQSLIQYRRLDGSMSLALRDKAVKEFNSDPEVTVMLMSLKAGNLGLNMVAACHVILLDLWWNPTTEDQAVDRAHRIGQTRPVTVSRLTIKDTVEDRILALQEEKRKMVSSAFGDDQSGGHATKLTVDDLSYLFNV